MMESNVQPPQAAHPTYDVAGSVPSWFGVCGDGGVDAADGGDVGEVGLVG